MTGWTRMRRPNARFLVSLLVVAVLVCAVVVFVVLRSSASEASDCKAASQVERDLEPVNREIAEASDQRSTDDPNAALRQVATSYSTAERITRSGVDRMDSGKVRESTNALADQFAAVAAYMQKELQGEGDINTQVSVSEELGQRLEDFQNVC